MTEENRRFDDKFALRLPKALKDQIAAQATLNNRSTNAEMVARLEASLVPDFEAGNRIDDLAREVETLRAEVRALATEVRRKD